MSPLRKKLAGSRRRYQSVSDRWVTVRAARVSAILTGLRPASSICCVATTGASGAASSRRARLALILRIDLTSDRDRARPTGPRRDRSPMSLRIASRVCWTAIAMLASSRVKYSGASLLRAGLRSA